MRILAISGSLRRGSYNGALLEAASAECPADVEFVVWRGLADLPAFDQDLETAPEPLSVATLKGEIARSDAVLISTPEYNASVPGALKNALDWASRPFAANVLRGKPVAVIGASTGLFGAVWAQAEVRRSWARSAPRSTGVRCRSPRHTKPSVRTVGYETRGKRPSCAPSSAISSGRKHNGRRDGSTRRRTLRRRSGRREDGMRPSVSWRRIPSPPASVSRSCSSSSPSPAGGSSFCNAATRRRSVRLAAASCSWSRRRLSPAQRASCSHGRCARAGPADSDAHDRHRSLRTRRDDRGRLLGGPRAQHEQRRRPPLAARLRRGLCR